MEHRFTLRLESYWNLLRKEEKLPEYSKFNASSISDIWKWCVLFHVLPAEGDNTNNLQINQVGGELKSIFGQEMIGKSISTAHRLFPAAAIVRRAREVILEPHVLFDEGQFVNDRSKVIRFRSCLAPFCTKDRVSHLVVCLTWREF